MRMRMDEEQPVADLTKAAQAARRAASRVSAGVSIQNLNVCKALDKFRSLNWLTSTEKGCEYANCKALLSFSTNIQIADTRYQTYLTKEGLTQSVNHNLTQLPYKGDSTQSQND